MNKICTILYGYGFGIILCYLFINTFLSRDHALDSNLIRQEEFIIDGHKFRLEPVLIKD